MNIIAQITGILAIIAFAISPQQKTKNKVLIFQLLSNILYALQYLILGAFSAVATSIIGAVNNLVFYGYAKKDKEIPIVLLYIYIIIILIAGILTYDNIFSIFPILLSILYTYGVWQSNLKIYRMIAVVGALAWIIYNWAVGAYANAIGNGFQCVSAIIAVIRLDIIKNHEKITS